jgi:hypothetical protein
MVLGFSIECGAGGFALLFFLSSLVFLFMRLLSCVIFFWGGGGDYSFCFLANFPCFETISGKHFPFLQHSQ